jgi:hypothetical protein
MSVVLALKLPDAIVLAADSRVARTEGDPHDHASKILWHDDAVFACAGHPLWDDKVDAFQIAQQVMESATPLTEFTLGAAAKLADAFTALATPHISKTLRNSLITPRPPGNTEKIPGLQFMFARLPGPSPSPNWRIPPSLSWRNLAATGSTTDGEELITTIEEYRWPGPSGTLIVAGQSDAIRRNILGQPIGTLTTVAEALALSQRLMGYEAAANPALVGGPMDAIVIGPKDIQWLERKAKLAYGWAAEQETT